MSDIRPRFDLLAINTNQFSIDISIRTWNNNTFMEIMASPFKRFSFLISSTRSKWQVLQAEIYHPCPHKQLLQQTRLNRYNIIIMQISANRKNTMVFSIAFQYVRKMLVRYIAYQPDNESVGSLYHITNLFRFCLIFN